MNKIIIICGVSGSGKNTLINNILADPKYKLRKVVTCTTRPKRPNENEGIDHYFVSQKEFALMIQNNQLLEHEKTHGYYYGTPVTAFLGDDNFIAEIDVRGALNIKANFPNALTIFVDVPLSSIKDRLIHRGENPIEIEKRLITARKEVELKSRFDIIISNQDNQLDQAIIELRKALDNYI